MKIIRCILFWKGMSTRPKNFWRMLVMFRESKNFRGTYHIIFFDTKILLANGNKVNEIQNIHKIVHYNYKSNLFMREDCRVYVVHPSNVVDFIEFKFVGDY